MKYRLAMLLMAFCQQYALPVVLASRVAAADAWIPPDSKGAAWTPPLDPEQLRRLPPVAPVSHEAVSQEAVFQEAVFHEAGASEQPSQPNEQSRSYDQGFLIASQGESGIAWDDFPFQMRVNGWAQLRQTLFDSDGPNQDQNTFSFERLRLSFGGHAISPDLKYFMQLDGNSDRSTQVIFLDYFATYDLGSDVFRGEENQLGLKFGKWKVPFSRSREESGRRLQFTDRATANIFFDLNRSIGAGLYGRLDSFAAPIHFETAVFNGFQTGSTSTNRGEGLDRNFGWSLRTHTDLFSDFGDDGEPDLSWHVKPALRLGGGIAYTRIDDQGESEFNRQRVVDSGATLASLLPAGVSAYNLGLYTVDAHWKHRGFSFIAEYYWRHITQFSGGSVDSLFDHGSVLQTGYFLRPKTLELLFRWSRIVGDSGTLGLVDQSSDEVAAGFAWYINGQNAKLVLDATHLNGAPVRSSRLDILPADAGWLFRTQLQIAF